MARRTKSGWAGVLLGFASLAAASGCSESARLGRADARAQVVALLGKYGDVDYFSTEPSFLVKTPGYEDVWGIDFQAILRVKQGSYLETLPLKEGSILFRECLRHLDELTPEHQQKASSGVPDRDIRPIPAGSFYIFGGRITFFSRKEGFVLHLLTLNDASSRKHVREDPTLEECVKHCNLPPENK